MHEACGCIPPSSDYEIARFDKWLSGEDVEGFPAHDSTPFVGHRADEDYLPTDWASLEKYRRRERLKNSLGLARAF